MVNWSLLNQLIRKNQNPPQIWEVHVVHLSFQGADLQFCCRVNPHGCRIYTCQKAPKKQAVGHDP